MQYSGETLHDSEVHKIRAVEAIGYHEGVFVIEENLNTLGRVIDGLDVLDGNVLEGLSSSSEQIRSLYEESSVPGAEPEISSVALLNFLNQVYAKYVPEQTDPNAQVTRWTMDWKKLTGKLKSKIEGKEKQISIMMIDQFPELINTTMPSDSSMAEGSLEFITGGANAQPLLRSGLALFALAGEKFRAEAGFKNDQKGLNGEDGLASGWLTDFEDPEVIAEVRKVVQTRIEHGEIDPSIIVGGSSADARILSKIEIENMKKAGIFDTQNMPIPLYPEKGLTEADAMLSGAKKIFGYEEGSQRIFEFSGNAKSAERLPHKLIQFESDLGVINVIATTGSEANMYDQIRMAIEGGVVDIGKAKALHGYTTAIYTMSQRLALAENARKAGLNGDVAMYGMSANAAGIDRKIHVLVGELATYIRALHATAFRTSMHAEAVAKLESVEA